MRIICLLTVFLALPCLLPGGVAAEPASPPLDTLEHVVEQLVDIRSEIASEKRAWRNKEQAWKYEIQLLDKEISALRKEVNTSRESEATALKGKAEFVGRKEELEQVLKQFPALLDRAEAQLKTWRTVLPPPLAVPLAKAFLQLPNSASKAKALSPSRRLQVVVALYTKIEGLHQNIHVTKELLKTGESIQREMDVLYLGLARAFAVSSDNRHAAIGSPKPGGWSWDPADPIATDIRKAISMFNREQTPELVTLPLSVSSFTPLPQPKADTE